ncbi:MAG: hypothetical protein IKP74_00385 [Clostridia bacterium]|nr:hypothetical protein [Clostridia bacterium]
MGFWKKYSYQIVRLFVIQIGIAIFSLVLSFAVSTAFRDRGVAALFFVSVLSTLFYLFILYSVAWEIGGKDRLKLDAVHEAPRGGVGFLIALVAAVPNLLFDLLMLIGGILYRGGSTAVGSGFIAVGFTPSFFIQSTYQGIVSRLLSAFSLVEPTAETAGSASYYLVAALLFIAVAVPAIVVTGFAYWMGMNEKRIIPQRRPGNDAR